MHLRTDYHSNMHLIYAKKKKKRAFKLLIYDEIKISGKTCF